jgi:hypothetical protein
VAKRVWVDRHAVGGTKRAGEIVEVLGTPEHPRYRIRWEDGHESIVAPGSDASLPRVSRGRATSVEKPAAVSPQARPARLAATPGDRLVVRPHRLGEPERDAEILEVGGPEGAPPFVVRWSDTGHESKVFPGPDAFVEHLAGPVRQARKRSRRPAAG